MAIVDPANTSDLLGILAPTAKPKVPAVAEASGAAANATGRMVETRMFEGAYECNQVKTVKTSMINATLEARIRERMDDIEDAKECEGKGGWGREKLGRYTKERRF